MGSAQRKSWVIIWCVFQSFIIKGSTEPLFEARIQTIIKLIASFISVNHEFPLNRACEKNDRTKFVTFTSHVSPGVVCWRVQLSPWRALKRFKLFCCCVGCFKTLMFIILSVLWPSVPVTWGQSSLTTLHNQREPFFQAVNISSRVQGLMFTSICTPEIKLSLLWMVLNSGIPSSPSGIAWLRRQSYW